MRKKLALLLALALILCLFGACGQGGSTAETTAPVESVSVPVEQATPEPEEPAPVEEASAEAPSSAEEVSEAKPVDIPPLAVTLPLDETATVTIWDVFPPPLVGYMEGTPGRGHTLHRHGSRQNACVHKSDAGGGI